MRCVQGVGDKALLTQRKGGGISTTVNHSYQPDLQLLCAWYACMYLPSGLRGRITRSGLYPDSNSDAEHTHVATAGSAAAAKHRGDRPSTATW